MPTCINEDSIDNTDRNFVIKVDSDQSSFNIDPVTGFLTAKAYFTRAGVFTYKLDKLELRELRPGSEVFDEESIQSLALKPITDMHPDKDLYPNRLVTVENIKDLQIGTTGSKFEKVSNEKGDFLAGDIVITDKDMVDTLVARKNLGLTTELSGGYKCKVDIANGVHDSDGPYNCVQKKIRYNHVSVVPYWDNGRAGKEVRILDSKSKQKEGKMPENLVKFTRKAINLDSIKMDAISVTLSEDAINVVSSLSSKLDSVIEIVQVQESDIARYQLDSKKDGESLVQFKKEKDELQAKYDQLEEASEKLKTDMEELSDPSSARVVAMLAENKLLTETAAKLKVNVDGKDIGAIKLDCIKVVSPEFDANGKSVDYLNARFDSIVEGLKVAEKDAGNKALGSFVMNATDSKTTKPTDPRQEFINKSQEAAKK